jgi:hypothetical protein
MTPIRKVIIKLIIMHEIGQVVLELPASADLQAMEKL